MTEVEREADIAAYRAYVRFVGCCSRNRSGRCPPRLNPFPALLIDTIRLNADWQLSGEKAAGRLSPQILPFWIMIDLPESRRSRILTHI